MKNYKVHFSKASDEWGTPWEFFNAQAEKYGPFDMDVCATPELAKCKLFFSPLSDGLKLPWDGVCWCNPPYSNAEAWVLKALTEVKAGRASRVVMLLAARTSNHWWHELIFPYATRIDWVRGRIKFIGGKSSAPFCSAVVVFGEVEA